MKKTELDIGVEARKAQDEIDKFVSDRKNQLEAIRTAQEIKQKSNGTWFTLDELRSTTRPVKEVRGKIIYGSPTSKIEELEALMHTLSLFGLMKRKVRAGKRTKYKVRFEAAAKAIKAHNDNMKVGVAINKKLKEKEQNGSR